MSQRPRLYSGTAGVGKGDLISVYLGEVTESKPEDGVPLVLRLPLDPPLFLSLANPKKSRVARFCRDTSTAMLANCAATKLKSRAYNGMYVIALEATTIIAPLQEIVVDRASLPLCDTA